MRSQQPPQFVPHSFNGSRGKLAQFRIVVDKPRGDIHLLAAHERRDFESVHHGFANIVIVGDGVGISRFLSNGFDAFHPRFQFIERIEVVVPFTHIGFCREPAFVVAPVQTHVANRSRDFRARPYGSLE